MKSKMKLNNCLMILMAALFLLSLSVPVLAQQGRPFDPGPPRDGIWSQLTEEQRQEILSTLSSLHESEASREEVIETIEALFDSYDVELPEGWLPRFLRHLHHRQVWHSIMDQLTDEQKQELHELIRDQRQAGATREEIHQSVRALLESYGIELPADWEIGYDDDRFGDREKPSPRRRSQRKINNISNHPNPFNPDTRIVYTLESPEYVTLRIFNLQGQLIRTLVSQHQSAGNYSAYWDGNNQNGDPMVSGHYLYQIQAGNEIRSGRMILMK